METFWSLLVFFTPQIVFIMMGIIDTLKDAKEDKAKRNSWKKNV